MLSADIAPLTTAAAEVTVVRNLQQPLSDSRAADLIEVMACVSVCARVYARVRVSVWVCACMQWVVIISGPSLAW